MLKRDRNGTERENIPVKISERSTSANGGMEISQKKLSENSLQRFKNMASGILGKNRNNTREGIQTQRTVLADMKNVTNEDNKRIGKDGGESKFSLFTSKLRRSFSVSPKVQKSKESKKSSEKKQTDCGNTLCKDLTKVVPIITNTDTNLRSQHVLKSDAFPTKQNLKQEPTFNEITPPTSPIQYEPIKLLKPLPFLNGKRTVEDRYYNEVVYCEEYAADNWDYLFYIENKGVVPSNFLHGSRVCLFKRKLMHSIMTEFKVIIVICTMK
ncbi:unnamed protein product [Onchocerca flexuosa]|uniref:Uncharacterized protein n=1 Tax=Onchocerca flexuosa TaxID=387005 RepID=A0A183HE36_9BILA|nr:unnamed protein product [Onchocerca flexuosa]